MERVRTLRESIVVDASPERVFAVVSEVRRTGEWSPECFKVLARRAPSAVGDPFVGFNRRGPWLWFTFCRVTRIQPEREFAFRVHVLGLPIAEWGYGISPDGSGTRLTEHWRDLRQGRSGRLADLLGLLFAGSSPARRTEINLQGMRTTLERLKAAVEGTARTSA